jgi:WD40 repeat protein
MIRVVDLATGQEESWRGHEEAVSCVKFSPDGTLLATGSRESMRIWDTSSGAEAACFKCRRVTNVAFSPDGRWLAETGGTDVTVWDIQTLEQIAFESGDGNDHPLVGHPSRFIDVSGHRFRSHGLDRWGDEAHVRVRIRPMLG